MFDHLFAVLAATYIMYALMHLDGFMGILDKFREFTIWLEGKGFKSPYIITICPYCMGFYTGGFVSFLLHWGNWREAVVFTFAYAAGSIALYYLHERYMEE